MARRTLNLSALPWQFGCAQRTLFSPQPADDRATVTEWLAARVPGDVRADLIAAGRIPPVETPEGIAAGTWVDGHDWWYRVDLPGDRDTHEQVYLEADGIDYYSAIWLDGHLLSTHAGMFSRQVLCLSPGINAPGTHELAVRVWGAGALPVQPNPSWRRAVRWLAGRLVPGIEYFPDRMMTPKAQFGFGWDFAPRLLSTGIWDDVRLVSCRGAYIEDLHVYPEPLTASMDPTPVRWHVRLTGRAWESGPLRAELEIVDAEDAGAESWQLGPFEITPDPLNPVGPGACFSYTVSVDTARVRRWWPWDQGEPRCYRITARLLYPGQRDILDETCVVAGVRSIRQELFPDGISWRFVLNGRPVFLRGANWVPADVLPGRVTATDYERLLGMARSAGVNFLRIWGGGIREKRVFWDLCDRLGIMVWQEFPLACAFLDHYPRSRAYLNALEQEARGMVRALHNRPSLIAWCGGNEFSIDRERLPLARLARVLAEDAAARPFIPASPSPGEVHQWNVWHGYAPWTTLAHETAALMHEFGMQAIPAAGTVAEMFPGGAPVALDDSRWTARKAQIAKLRWYAGSAADDGLPAAIHATQRAQAAALQTGIEACRLRRESFPPPGAGRGTGRARCGGVTFWQFNEPWPAVSWAVIDRAGRPKLAYEMLCRSFQPVMVAARFPWRRYGPGHNFPAEIWLVNDGAEGSSGCHIEARLDGEVVWAQAEVDLPAASAVPVGRMSVHLSASPTELSLALFRGDTTLALNRYDLSVHLPGCQPLIARATRWLSDCLIRI